ncbi:uncharacterized protein LOC142239479 [Haematobia irritans]|uniref:uncharacterized protein LOC142239479 n=1 Tax=Haematobia irritans TaxID=7368 RepID=UPI003F4FD912
MVRVCVFNCKNPKHLYGFPKDPEEKMNWCEILGLNANLIRPNNKLCEKHFDPKYVGQKNLKKSLVPPVPFDVFLIIYIIVSSLIPKIKFYNNTHNSTSCDNRFC